MRGTRHKLTLCLLAALATTGLPMLVHAQMEGEDRGIAPINSSGDFMAENILVETRGKSADEARHEGWRVAQRLGWSKLWAKMHGGTGARLPDSRLDGIVSAIEIVEEEIGPHRYKAKLNVYFDRARAGQILGVSGVVRRSAPLMVIPVQVSGGAEIVFEQRTPWQRAWARYRTADSRIDYVRPSGSGAQSLIVNAGQLGRRNREWWRVILEQFGAADVIMPVLELDRKYPGGPVTGRFIARFGPDNERLGAFTLSVKSEDQIDAMLDQAIERLDRIYATALANGRLQPDRSLVVQDPIAVEEVDETPLPAPTRPVPQAPRDVELSGGGNAPASSGNPSSGNGQNAPDDGAPRNILPSDNSPPPARLGPRSGPPRPTVSSDQ